MNDWHNLVKLALAEDIGDGDVTTDCTITEDKEIVARLLAKSDGIVAGLEVFLACFQELDPFIQFKWNKSDGDAVRPGEEIALLKGKARAILTAERTALNFLQRMSGIATLTRQMVEAVKGTRAKILDTRKTAPGLRYFDKWAVRIGGGQNHRFGLYDMVLIKDNHIAACGGIRQAVERVRACDKKQRLIEVEVKNLDELREAIDSGVDRILLDNMSPETMKQAVEICGGRIPLEASGNVTIETVRPIAESGVDFISVGALTHSVKALDVSLIV
ncbi:carboxylating nicotinate-nucleotide diphosphorylase [Caldithrix abyssi]